MTVEFSNSEGLLILPHLNIQNANAISSPLTHGFPAMSAFLGLMWALERKLAELSPRLYFDSVGVICHGFEEQTTEGGYVKGFHLTRNPVGKDGGTTAIVEEGRIHLDLTLVFGISGNDEDNIVMADDDRRERFAADVGHIVAGMRVAGGSVLPSIRGPGRRLRPQLIRLAEKADAAEQQFRDLRRQWLPGFALVCRDDLLQQRIAHFEKQSPPATALDAWLDLSRFNWRSWRIEPASGSAADAKPRIEWNHDRREGWIVPIPVGYGALSDLHAAGTVLNARDEKTPFRFVESLYSIGQWIAPHRLNHPADLLWYAHSDPTNGLYRCRNDFARTMSAHSV